MESPEGAVKAAMLARLRGSESFSTLVKGTIFDEEATQFPCAWIGVTGSDPSTGVDCFFATLHVWERSGAASAKAAIDQARAVLQEAPVAAGVAITSWGEDYSEVRRNDDYLGDDPLPMVTPEPNPRVPWEWR
jgi:hypothetical protein